MNDSSHRSRKTANVCAKLTTIVQGRKEGNVPGVRSFIIVLPQVDRHMITVIHLTLNKPIIIGRNPDLWFFSSFLPPSLQSQKF